MPLIAFTTPSPSSHLPRDDGAPKPDHLNGKSLNVASSSIQDDAALCSSNNFPLVRLDVDAITDCIAGRLATNLLGHVLFLKNQIPL